MSPLEPLYTLRVAVEMIPFPSENALRVWLHRHRDEFPGRYRRTGHGSTRIRLLTQREVIAIRARFLVKAKSRSA